MAKNSNYKISRTPEEDRLIKNAKYSEGYNVGLDRGNAFAIDIGIIALGRTLQDIDNAVYVETIQNYIREYLIAATEFNKVFMIDIQENRDKEFWWAGDKLDKEVREYMTKAGISYPDFKDRYHIQDKEFTEADRDKMKKIMEMWNKK